MTWRTLTMVLAVAVGAAACGGGSDDSNGSAAARVEGSSACSVIEELRTSGPTGLEVVGSPEWYSRMVQAADLYRQLQQVAPDDVADDLAAIVAAQDVLLADLEPPTPGGSVNSAEASARLDAYIDDPALVGPGASFATFVESIDCP